MEIKTKFYDKHLPFHQMLNVVPILFLFYNTALIIGNKVPVTGVSNFSKLLLFFFYKIYL